MAFYPLATETWAQEEIEAINSVIESRNFTMGRKVRDLRYLKYNSPPSLPNAEYIDKNGLFIDNHHFDISPRLNKVSELITSLATHKR
jgi:hypothetical protein